MSSDEYFKRRAVEREKNWYRRATKRLDEEVSVYFKKSLDAILRDIAALYAKYADENGLSLTEARKLIRGDEFQVWRMTLEEYLAAAKFDSVILKELNTLAMRSRISRLEALHARTLMELADLCERLNQFEDAFQYRAYVSNYYGTLYDIHREIGLHTPPVAVDSEQVKKVIRSAWVGANYSARIWRNTERLAVELKSTMERAVHRGDSIQKLSKNLARRMEVGYNNAERLVRTELNFIQNKAALDSITDAGLDCYRFVSALDNRTCPRCGSLDGQVFEVTESMPGENFPPMHPRCRCTIVPTLGEQTGKRTSKVAGKREKVPQSMTFTEWKKIYVDKTVSGSAEIFPKIIGQHTQAEDLKAVNPNYGKGVEWQRNCQRCVPTYEMRRRGYDVTAKPAKNVDKDFLRQGGNHTKVFDNPQVMSVLGVDDISNYMVSCGNGARASVSVVWEGTGISHVFAVENRAGKIIFIDPQRAVEGKVVENYFEFAKEGYILLYRTDNLKFTDLIKECCEEVKK